MVAVFRKGAVLGSVRVETAPVFTSMFTEKSALFSAIPCVSLQFVVQPENIPLER